MKPISTDLEIILQSVQLREDEFLDETSKLIYCSRCRTPRQKRFEMTGKLFEPRCMCACQTAAYEQREQEQKHREFLDTVAKNRSVGLTDPVLRKHTFENDLGYNPKQMNMAKRFVQHWDEFRQNSMGLLLWGNVGTGKSFIAGCIANALLDQGVPVMMTNFARLLNKLTDMYYNAKDPLAEVYTHDTNLKKRLRKYAAKYPELCKQTDDDGQGGLRFEIDKSRISIRLTAPHSDDRRKATSVLAKRQGIHTKP